MAQWALKYRQVSFLDKEEGGNKGIFLKISIWAVTFKGSTADLGKRMLATPFCLCRKKSVYQKGCLGRLDFF